MPLDQAQLRHIALLARLELTVEEEASFANQLEHILHHFEKLQELDTTAVEPTAHIVDIETPFRDDVVCNAPAVELLLANAPARHGAYFRVPKIIE